MAKKEIVYLPVEKIFAHPQNPRKDLGDLTELAESIKANGVLQNLTVVPIDGESWRAVIGHRRLAAAKLAGLTEVPSVVEEMTEAEQVRTMLMENMQRSDLTVYEQAQGFQMMLDMGGTVESVAKDTGFSTTTVRHRIKLLDLDKDKFKKSEARGASITDYIELEKVEDPGEKNKLLDAIGTADFRSKLKRVLEDQEQKKRITAFAAAAAEFAEKIDNVDYSTMSYVTRYSCYDKGKTVERPEDADTACYYYTEDNWGVTIYREKAKEDEGDAAAAQAEREKEEAEKKRRRADLEEATARAYTLRQEFIKGVSTQTAKKHLGEIVAFIILMGVNDAVDIAYEDAEDLLGCTFDFENSEFTLKDAIELVESPERSLLLAAYCIFGDDKDVGYVNTWRLEHEENRGLDDLYLLLEKLGYEMSSEEKALQDGTYETFEREAE